MVFDCVRLWVAIRLTQSGPDITCEYWTIQHSLSPCPYMNSFLPVTDYQAPTAMWTCTESAVGIVGACLPNLKPLFKFGSGNFWSQLRSSRGSNRALMNSNTSHTTSTSETLTVEKPHLTDHISDQGTQGIEVHRYSRYAKGEK